MSKGGGLKKTCPACKNKIFNGFKKCPMCKASQPKNVRLKKKIEKFEQKKKTWVANTKKNQVTSHLWDDAIILVSNFCCSMSPVQLFWSTWGDFLILTETR